jgi:uncharacterized protein
MGVRLVLILSATLLLSCRGGSPAGEAPPDKLHATGVQGRVPALPPQAATTPARVPLHVTTASGNRIALSSEIAATPEARARGLMYRRSLGRYEAMLFPMGHDSDWSFYMKNTLIPLDMLFLAADGTVVGLVANARPLDEAQRTAGVLSRFVLEVNGNFCREHGITVGAKVEFPPPYAQP